MSFYELNVDEKNYIRATVDKFHDKFDEYKDYIIQYYNIDDSTSLFAYEILSESEFYTIFFFKM